MKIRVGYDLTYSSPSATPMILALNIHPSRAADVIVQMTNQLRSGLKLDVIRDLNERMQSIESEADRLILDLYRDLFTNERDPAKLLLRKDLFDAASAGDDDKLCELCRQHEKSIFEKGLIWSKVPPSPKCSGCAFDHPPNSGSSMVMSFKLGNLFASGGAANSILNGR